MLHARQEAHTHFYQKEWSIFLIWLKNNLYKTQTSQWLFCWDTSRHANSNHFTKSLTRHLPETLWWSPADWTVGKTNRWSMSPLLGSYFVVALRCFEFWQRLEPIVFLIFYPHQPQFHLGESWPMKTNTYSEIYGNHGGRVGVATHPRGRRGCSIPKVAVFTASCEGVTGSLSELLSQEDWRNNYRQEIPRRSLNLATSSLARELSWSHLYTSEK